MENTSPILDILPGIHTTLIGFVGALYTAFALYAYEQLRQAHENLEQALAELSELCTPYHFISGVGCDGLLEAGELDWDGQVKDFLREAQREFELFIREPDEVMIRFSMQLRPSNERMVELCKQVWWVFGMVFVTYPFSGKLFYSQEGVTEFIEAKKAVPFDHKRLDEMVRRLAFLSFYCSTTKGVLLQCAQYATQADAVIMEAEREKWIDEISGMSVEEKQDLKNRRKTERSHNITDYEEILSKCFDRVRVCTEFLPTLRKSVSVRKQFYEHFKLKETTQNFSTATIFILLFGVVLPLVLRTAERDVQFTFWRPFVEYIILFLTSLPYLWMCFLLRIKASKSQF